MACGDNAQRELLSNHNIARYCSPRRLDEDGIPLEGAFLLRSEELYLSTNWLEYFHAADRPFQIECVKQSLIAKGLRVSKNAALTVLNVGTTISGIMEELGLQARVTTLGEVMDPSHTGVYGIAENRVKVVVVLARLVDPNEVYPTG